MYDSSLSFHVICVQTYLPCGVLVPTSTVNSNNEFIIYSFYVYSKIGAHVNLHVGSNKAEHKI